MLVDLCDCGAPSSMCGGRCEDQHATNRAGTFCEADLHPVTAMAVDGYCFQCAMAAARQRCILRGEGWRWGVKPVLTVQWYPGANKPGGAWHVVADGWRHISSHPTRDAALAAMDGQCDPDPGA